MELDGRYALPHELTVRCVTITVSGYDTSLPEEDVKSLLSQHFSSCGDIANVYFPNDPLDKSAFVDIYGDDAEEKALQLNGSDMGGRNLVVEVVPPLAFKPLRRTPGIIARLAKLNESLHRNSGNVVLVTGYDTGLPEEGIKSALRNLFSSCGEILSVCINKDRNDGLEKTAVVHIRGEGVANKVRELSGSDVGGWKAVVLHCSEQSEVTADGLYAPKKTAKRTRE